jgi:hypothetical protein
MTLAVEPIVNEGTKFCKTLMIDGQS